jgi:hypothetical protein
MTSDQTEKYFRNKILLWCGGFCQNNIETNVLKKQTEVEKVFAH